MNEATREPGLRQILNLFLFLCLLGCASCERPPSNAMTPARFREIVSMPGDSMPLAEPLASLPFWTNSIISNVMTYASGKVFQEEMRGTLRTVQGKYVVNALESKFYGQTMHGISTYDPERSVIVTYGLYGDGRGGEKLTETVVRFDLAKKTYTCSSAYDEFTETSTGRYTEAEDISKSVVFKNGAPFMTREVIIRPVAKDQH